MNRLEQFDVYSIACSSVHYDAEFNCRREFTLQSIQELGDSIRDEGLKFPIVVQPACDVKGIPPGFAYRLVAGHRRFKAATIRLQWTEIPARIVNGLNEKQAASFNLIENLERKDLNVLEEAIAMMRLYPNSTDREIAAELHKYPMWVCRRKILLRQPEEIQQMTASGRLSLQQVQDIIHPIRTKSAKISAARRIAMDSGSEGRAARREYRQITRPRTRKEISDKIALMLELGLHEKCPLLTRFAAWCGRGISDKELEQDLAKFANQNEQ